MYTYPTELPVTLTHYVGSPVIIFLPIKFPLPKIYNCSKPEITASSWFFHLWKFWLIHFKLLQNVEKQTKTTPLKNSGKRHEQIFKEEKLLMASKHKKNFTKSNIDLKAIRYLLISNKIVMLFKKIIFNSGQELMRPPTSFSVTENITCIFFFFVICGKM